jgi:hypothetical protein
MSTSDIGHQNHISLQRRGPYRLKKLGLNMDNLYTRAKLQVWWTSYRAYNIMCLWKIAYIIDGFDIKVKDNIIVIKVK